MTSYAVVALVAAVTTALVTPAVARLARRIGAVDRPDERKIHASPVPSLGGIALVLGVTAAIGSAWVLEPTRTVLTATSEVWGIAAGVVVIAAVGIVDDLRGLPPTVKLAGQIVAALIPTLSGVQVVYAWLPGVEVVALAPDLGLPLTILLIVAMVNAVNLIDGLDGLAAGVVAIAAAAFFAFIVTSETRGIAESAPTVAPVVAAAVVGACAGFLLYNFHPARIFMGDTGSMVLGLLLATAGVSYVGRTTAPSYADFAVTVPLITPVLVLAVPFVDTAFAVVRRLVRGQPITAPDRGHLHHLLIAFGHSHRRAVLTLYYWSAVVAFGTVGVAVLPPAVVGAVLAAAVLVGVVVTAPGLRRSRPAALDADRARRAGP